MTPWSYFTFYFNIIYSFWKWNWNNASVTNREVKQLPNQCCLNDIQSIETFIPITKFILKNSRLNVCTRYDLGTLMFLLTSFSFQIFRLWAYLMKVTPETCRAITSDITRNSICQIRGLYNTNAFWNCWNE